MNILTRQIIWITTVILIGACNNHKNENEASNAKIDNPILKNETVQKETKTKELNNESLEIKEDEFEGYTFRCGYEKYDEDKFGFENPGFLEVFKNDKIIFKDTFKGQGDVYVKSLGYHKLSGNKLIFILNWGTEACDYTHHSKYYVITSDSKIIYLNEYWGMSGGDGYASRFYDHVFPEETLGMTNSILIVEGMKYHEHDQPDLSDTTYISFKGNEFSIIKTTNNLDEGK